MPERRSRTPISNSRALGLLLENRMMGSLAQSTGSAVAVPSPCGAIPKLGLTIRMEWIPPQVQTTHTQAPFLPRGRAKAGRAKAGRAKAGRAKGGNRKRGAAVSPSVTPSSVRWRQRIAGRGRRAAAIRDGGGEGAGGAGARI